MFAAHEVSVQASFDSAVARLLHLINQGALRAPSEAAYEGGLAFAVRVGPFGGVRGFSKLVRVRFLEPVRRGATMSVALRWEATGLAGELFPVLDADLTLARAGDDRVGLALAGAYRPPLGPAGAALDKAVMHAVAAATIRSLVENVAAAIADPAPELLPGTDPAHTDPAPRWRPVTEPQEP